MDATWQRSLAAPADPLTGSDAAARGRLSAVLLRDQEAVVSLAAAAVVAVVALVRTIAAARGWFFNDDLGWEGVAASYRFPSSSLLATSWNQHLQPAGWVVIWAFTHAMPLRFWPVVASTGLLVAAHGWATFLLLRRLFGARPEIVLLVALAVGSSLTLSASLWWAVQLVQLPLLVLSTLTVWAFLGYLQLRRTRDLVLTATLLVADLLFSERALLLPVLLLFLQIGWFSGSGRLLSRVRHALWSCPGLWVSVGAIATVYLAWYLRTAPSPARTDYSARLFVDVTSQAVEHALAPALFGGPWTWLPIDYAASVANPGRVVRLVALTVLVGLIAWSCATRKHAARAWALLLLFFLIGSAMLTVTRAPLVGPIIGREYRYFTELALVAPLALGLATLPLRWRSRDDESVLLQRRAPAPSVVAATADWAPVGAMLQRHRGLAVASATVAFLVAATVSAAGYDAHWSRNSARGWMSAAQHELARHPEALIANTTVPPGVEPPIAGFYTKTSVLLRPVAPADRFLTAGWAGDELRALGSDGRLKPVKIAGVAAPPGPVPGCGWLVSAKDSIVPLQGSTLAGRWLVRVSYYTARDETAHVEAGRTSFTVVLHAGLHVVHLMADGPVRELVASAGSPVCITAVEAGDPQAAES